MQINLQLRSLLEDLAISKALDFPGHVLFDLILLLLILGRLDLLELVGWVISSIVDLVRDLLATDDEVTRDGVVVVGTGDEHGTESILASTLKTGEETTNQVVGHEDKSQLVVVTVVNAPDGPTLLIKVLPEPLHGNIGIVVAVHTLPFIKNEAALGKKIQSRLGLGSRLRSFLSRSGSSLLGLLLLFLLLLLGRSVLQSSLAKSDFTKSFLELGLVDAGGEVTVDVLVLGAESLVKDELVTQDEGSDNSNIGKSDVLTNKVGLGQKNLVQSIHSTLDLFDTSIDIGLHVRVVTKERIDPLAKVGVDLVLGKEDPLHDQSLLNVVGAQDGVVLLLKSSYYPYHVSLISFLAHIPTPRTNLP